MRRDIPVIACVLRCPELLTEEGLEHTLPHPAPIKHMSLHPHDHSVLSLDAEGRLGLWPLAKRPPAFTLLDSGYTDALDAVAFHPVDGRHFAAVGEGVDGQPYLALCDLQPALGAGVVGGSAVVLAKRAFPTGRLANDTRLTFTADGGTVLVSVVRTLGPDGPQPLQAPVDVWGVTLGAEELLTLKGRLGVRGGRTDALAVSPYGSEALFSEGKMVVRLDLEGRRELGRLQQGAEVSCIAVNRWGWALVGDSTGGIKLWDGGLGPSFPLISAVAQAHAGAVTCAAATADGWLMITGGCDGWIRVWRLPDLVCVADVEALHAGQAVRHLAATRDGLLLVSGGDNGMLRIEDLTQLQAQMTLTRGGRA